MANLVLRDVERASISLSVITWLEFANWDVNQDGKKENNAKQAIILLLRVVLHRIWFFSSFLRKKAFNLLKWAWCTEILLYSYLECDNGSYGLNCSETCGNCLKDTICHHVNGTCLEGCAAGYKTQTCKTGKTKFH